MFFDAAPPSQVEAEARALTEGFGGEEGGEDAIDDLVGDARAVVADLDPNHVVGFPFGSQRQRAVAVHRLNRVVDDVGPDLVEIAWVAQQFGQGLVHVLDDLDRAPYQSANVHELLWSTVMM